MNCAGKFNLLYIAPTTAAVVGIFLHLKVKKDEKHAVRVKGKMAAESEDLRW